MPKLFTSNGGYLLDFDTIEQLEDGNLFIHVSGGTVSQPVPQAKPKVVDISSRRPKEEERPVIRKAMPPPKEEPKLGIKCKRCHQSRITMIEDEIGVIEEVLILTNKPETFISIGKEKVNDPEFSMLLFEDKNKYFYRKSDEEVAKFIGNPEFTTIQELAIKYSSDTLAYCPACQETLPLQDWINEYAHPNTPYFSTCKMCGSEMEIISGSDKFNPSGNHSLVCSNKECGHRTDYLMSK